MRVLITGGAGFIGSHIVEYFQNRAEVRVLDNLRTGHRQNLAGLPCDFMLGSILDRDLVRQAVQGVDYVFHLAAMISVPESMEQPIACVEINTLGTLVLLEEAARAGIRLTQAGMMIPLKSISFVVGVGKDMAQTDTCAVCTLKETCRYRHA